jgi:branched-chain amino acid aminotransferase
MAVLEVIRDIGIPLEVTDIPSKDLNNLDEAFYTVSLQHIQPIQSIEGRDLGDCCPGPVTEKIINAMNEIYSGKNKKYERWLKYIE